MIQVPHGAASAMTALTKLADRKRDLYSVEFFDLQLRFAQKVAELSGLAVGEAVGCYTNIYVRLAMGQRLDANNPEWQRYLAGLVGAPERAAWTHEVHRQRLPLQAGPRPAATVGRFSYELIGADRARLHFHAAGGASPLSAEHRDQRLGELAELFAHLKASSNDRMHVVGASWLYNLDRYRRLFPERYLSSLRSVEHPYQRMPLWGQFLARDRTVRPAGSRFLTNIAHASSLSELARCFPLSVLATVAPAWWFYDHLGL